MTDAVEERILSILQETLDIDLAGDIPLDTPFGELGLNSLGGLTLIAELEKEYNIKVPNDRILLIRTIRQAADSITERLENANSSHVAHSHD